jgi:CRP/FNR family transcriptional regulator, cyclic AMP receptor protein
VAEVLHTSPWIRPAGRGEAGLEALLRPWAVERYYAQGAVLTEQGQPVPGLYFLLEGSVKQLLLGPGGQERLIMQVEAGCFVGDKCALDGLPAQVTSVAKTGVRTLLVPAERVVAMLQADGRIALSLIESLSRNLRATVKLVSDMTLRPVQEQLSCLLHQLCRQQGPDGGRGRAVTLSLSHQELADLLGVSRVTISLGLSALKEQGLIETGHRVVRVMNSDGLACCGDAPFCVGRA